MKRNALLVAILVILLVVFLVLRFWGGRRAGEEPLYPDFDAARAVRFSVEAPEAVAALGRADGIWLVVSEDSLPAEAGAADRMLENITGFSRKDIISSNPEKYGLYKVDSTGVWVTVSNAPGDTLARFVVGKPGPDFRSTYVRDVASGDVILAPGYLQPVFDRGKRSWQDRTIFAFEPDEIVRIDIRRRDEALTLRKDGAGGWFAASPESTACDQQKMTRLTRTLAYLKCDDFAGRAPVPNAGLAEPDSSISLRTSGGIREELIFGGVDDTGQVLAKRAGSDIVYLLAAHRVEAMLPELADLCAEKRDAAEGVQGGKGP